MKNALIVLFALLLAGSGSGKEVDLVFESAEIVTGSLKDISIQFGPKSYSGNWATFFSYAGDLDELKEASAKIDHQFTPIVFSDRKPDFRPVVGIHHESIAGTSKVRLDFFCVPYQKESNIKLDQRTIYFYDTETRGVVKIGKFESSDDREEIEKKARNALKAHLKSS